MQPISREIFFCHLAAHPFDVLRAALPEASCHDSSAAAEGPDGFERLALALRERVRRALDAGVAPPLVQVVFDATQYAIRSGVAGLFLAIRTEHPEFRGQTIAFDRVASPASLAARLGREAAVLDAPVEVLYRGEIRHVLDWRERIASADCPPPWRTGAVYLITGGFGGLGRLLIDALRESTAGDLRVIVAGRSSLDETGREQIEQWARDGLRVSYKRADITVRAEVDELVEWTLRTCGRLDGILHGAGVIRDNLLRHKPADEFSAVLAPKVHGTVNLDEATRQVPLSFFALFSSLSSVLGNPGQSDYAAGNGFMDGYARLRAEQVDAGLAHGRTVSINWPYWRDGGMRLADPLIEQMWRDSGMRPLALAAGLQALYRALALDDEQVIVASGDAARIRIAAARRETRGATGAPLAPSPGSLNVASAVLAAVPSTAAGPEARGALIVHLTGLVATQLGLAESRVRPDAPLSRYGIDSIMMVKVIAELETDFGSLPKTIFFEHQTLAELADYFVERHGGAVAARWPGERVTGRVGEVPIGPAPAEAKRAAPAPVCRARDDQADLIAIVAVAGRYPGAASVEAFWERLATGYDAIGEIPAARWRADDYYEARPEPGKSACKWGGFLDDVASFDPLFFRMTPREASVIDPNERLFLQTVQHLLDAAGLTRRRLAERYEARVGVFVGAMYQQYAAFDSDVVSESLTSIASYSSIANRVSHVFDLRGPSIALDTMCSSSLVALHAARESLLRGECRGAIVGGVNLSLHPKKYVGLGTANLLATAPDQRSFGTGQGYLPSEAVGAVLLRPLRDALRDNDTVLGVLRSTHVTHSGGQSHYATPNAKAQVALMEESFAKAGVTPATIGYVEAAATGAALSDAVELRALRKVFAAPGVRRAIGTVKSNIGHAEAASGIAQLTKVLLQLRHRKWLPTPAVSTPNPDIAWRDAPFALQSELGDWPSPEAGVDEARHAPPRRAAINSFGAGGTYAHVIIEECVTASPEIAPDVSAASDDQLIVLSARSRTALDALARLHRDRLLIEPAAALPRLARALRHERDACDERLAFVVPDIGTLLAELDAYCAGAAPTAPGRRFTGVSVEAGGVEPARGVMDAALAARDWRTLAACWAAGADLDWRMLDGDMAEPPLALPAYPFDAVRCWLEPAPRADADRVVPRATPVRAPDADDVRALLAEITGLSTRDWVADRPLGEYGLRSVSVVLLHQLLGERFVAPPLAQWRDGASIDDLVRACAEHAARPDRVVPEALASPRRYPELVSLNAREHGRPVFWIHAGIGGVEVYQALADRIERPFMGIQARGYLTNRAPLRGMQAMAAYYCHLILARQPRGPYSLGGYSLGGALAYEVVRQLQELGETVDTLVMIDSLDDAAMRSSVVSDKTLYLQSANLAIAAAHRGDADRALAAMIHQDEIDAELGDDAFLERVASAAAERGADASVATLRGRIRHHAQVQAAYDAARFELLPLPAPGAVVCHYLHNRGGDYFGELESYLFVRGEHSRLGETDYLEGWRCCLPSFDVIEIDAPCHMLMLSTQPSLDQVIAACHRIYAEPSPFAPRAVVPATGDPAAADA
ncbi:SDR family NAD(P)-dependent oxidoreductase [Burkholderia pyrrocinia]